MAATGVGEDDGCGVEPATGAGFSEGLLATEGGVCISAACGAVFATAGRTSIATSNTGTSTGGGVG